MLTRSARLMPRLGLSTSVSARVLNFIRRYKLPRTLDMLNYRHRQVLNAEMQGGLRVKFQRMGDCGTNGAPMTDNDNVFTLETLRKLVESVSDAGADIQHALTFRWAFSCGKRPEWMRLLLQLPGDIFQQKILPVAERLLDKPPLNRHLPRAVTIVKYGLSRVPRAAQGRAKPNGVFREAPGEAGVIGFLALKVIRAQRHINRAVKFAACRLVNNGVSHQPKSRRPLC